MIRNQTYCHGVWETFLGLFLSATFASAQTTDPREKADARDHPFTHISLPYCGYGEVSIVDDGEVAIQLGGRPAPDDDAPSGEVLGFVGLSFNTAGTHLLQTDKAWLIDAQGRQLAARGLTGRDVRSRIAFPPASASAHGLKSAARRSLLDLDGEVRLDFDPNTSTGSLYVEDSPTAGETGGGELMVRFSIRPLQTDADPSQALDAAQVCSCVADCNHGSCSISCDHPARCSCFCNGRGYAVCRCEDRQSVEWLP